MINKSVRVNTMYWAILTMFTMDPALCKPSQQDHVKLNLEFQKSIYLYKCQREQANLERNLNGLHQQPRTRDILETFATFDNRLMVFNAIAKRLVQFVHQFHSVVVSFGVSPPRKSTYEKYVHIFVFNQNTTYSLGT